MKKFFISFALVALIGSSVYAIDILNRTRSQSWVQGGTTSTSGSTLLESTSSTNIYQVVVLTATPTGAETTYTNTFTTPFLAQPSIFQGVKSGKTPGYGSLSVATFETNTSGAWVRFTATLVSTNSTATNGVPYIIHGYQRTGKFE